MTDIDFGFKPGDLETIVTVIQKYPTVDKALIFGSRGNNTYKQGSDVDIAIWTADKDVIYKLSGFLNEETLLPYRFDVIDYNELTNQQLKQNILKGIEIISR